MPTLRDTVFTHAILQGNKAANYRAEEATKAKAKALINFLMQDGPFLNLYRSNDPKERAVAMETLNVAHHQAYGDASKSRSH
jgi:hypothetical protein